MESAGSGRNLTQEEGSEEENITEVQSRVSNVITYNNVSEECATNSGLEGTRLEHGSSRSIPYNITGSNWASTPVNNVNVETENNFRLTERSDVRVNFPELLSFLLRGPIVRTVPSTSLFDQLLRAIRTENQRSQSIIRDKIKAAIESQTDSDATDAVLRAARETDLTVLRFLLDKFGADCLKVRGEDGNTIVHEAARLQGEASGPVALELLVEKLGMDCLRLEGFSRRKAVHCAAWNRRSPAALFWLIDHLQPQEFTADADAGGYSALQTAFECHSAGVLKLLVVKYKAECLKLQGPGGRTAIHHALTNKDPDVLAWLIDAQDSGALLQPDDTSTTPIHYAFRFQKPGILKLLVSKLGKDCLKLPGGKFDCTVVHLAAKIEDPSVLLWLLETQDKDAFLTLDKENANAIHWAFQHQSSDTLQLIVNKLGPDCLRVPGFSQRTAVHYVACNERHTDALHWFMETQSADSFLTPDNESTLALHLLFKHQIKEVLETLICKLGPDCLRKRGYKNCTAAHYAADNARSPSALLWLLDTQESELFFARNTDGESSIHIAFRSQKVGVAKLLVERLGSVSLEQQDNMMRTAVNKAAYNDVDPMVLLWLIESQDSSAFLTVDSDGETPVHLAFWKQDDKVAKTLVKKLGRDCLNLPGFSKRTPVHCAALNKRSPSVLLWLIDTQDCGAFLTTDSDGDTPVHLALWKQDVKVIKKLVTKLGADCLKLAGQDGWTPVHYAVRSEKLDLLRWIIGTQDRQMFYTKDADNESPIHLAFQEQLVNVAKLLVNELGAECLMTSGGKWNRTAVHYAAVYENGSGLLQWLIETRKQQLFLKADSQGSTAIHLVFGEQDAKVARMLVEKLDQVDCLGLPGFHDQTAVHYAATNIASADILAWLMNSLEPKAFLTGDADNVTALHLALRTQDAIIVRKLIEKVGPEALRLQGYCNWTAAHYAVRNIKSEDVFTIVSETAAASNLSDILMSPDAEGRTCLHLCSINHTIGEKLFRKIYPMFSFRSARDAIEQSVDKYGRNPLFTACLAKNFNFINAEFIDLSKHLCTDSDGNTLLHALLLKFHRLIPFSTDAPQLVKAAQSFSDAGAKLDAENSKKLNCLLASEIDEESLIKVIENIESSEMRDTFRALQRNSEGLHAAHVFSRRYNLKSIESSLSQLCGLSPDQLLTVRVSGGPMKGATCLNFASEACHKENMSYLVGKGIKLSDQTVLSVDFSACNSRKLQLLCDVEDTAEQDLSKVPKLVDLASRALDPQ